MHRGIYIEAKGETGRILPAAAAAAEAAAAELPAQRRLSQTIRYRKGKHCQNMINRKIWLLLYGWPAPFKHRLTKSG